MATIPSLTVGVRMRASIGAGGAWIEPWGRSYVAGANRTAEAETNTTARIAPGARDLTAEG